jgi:hypothetical protein
VLQIFCLFLIVHADKKPELHLTITPSVVQVGESFVATFSGPVVTRNSSFDVLYQQPGYDYDQVALNWQNHAIDYQKITEGMHPGMWQITGIRAHDEDLDSWSKQDFQRVNVQVFVLWPIWEKVLGLLIVVFQIFVLMNLPRWLKEAKRLHR